MCSPTRTFLYTSTLFLLVGCGNDDPEHSQRTVSSGGNTSAASSSFATVGGSGVSPAGTGGAKSTFANTNSGGAKAQGGGNQWVSGGGSSTVAGGSTTIGGTPTRSSSGGATPVATTASGGVVGNGGASGTTPTQDIDANFQNGIFLNDTSGKRIEAHGGGFLKEGATWYWVGEDKSHNSGSFKAVNIYSSTNLNDWQFRRAIITKSTATELGAADRIIERPKVIYNERNAEYVMWLHWEGQNYAEAKAGVFSSKTIDGNYTYRSAFRPNNNMARDDTLFKDDDGKAYFIAAANENKDLIVYELSDDYLTVKRQVVVLWASASREAPAVFKQSGRYYLITSACTGWDSNQAKYATATSMAGPWTTLANLGNSTTYDTQSTFVIPIVGSKATTFVFVGDRWQDPDLVGSKYIFLPLTVNGTSVALNYYDRWQLNLTTGNWSANDGFISQSDWKVLYVDSEETTAENGRASRAFDNDGNTFWHTEYQAKKPEYPHEVQIDLGATYALEAFRYLPRQDKDANGMVAKYEFYVSESATSFGSAVATGTFASTRNETIVKFTKKTGRYIRFVALSAVTADSNLASVGELDVVGVKQ